MLKKIFFTMFFLLAVCCSISMASDYKLARQNEACYGQLYYWVADNIPRYEIARNECNRYGLLLLQENLRPEKKDWLTKNVWLVRRGQWLQKRKALGEFLPRDSVVAYFAMLLETEGMDLMRDQDLLGHPLHYVDTSVTAQAE